MSGGLDRIADLNRTGQIEVVVERQNDQDDQDDQNLDPKFLEDVGKIKTLTSVIRRNVNSIKDAYNKQAWSSVDSNLQKSEELDTLLQDTNKSAGQVRNLLKRMKIENDLLSPEDPQKRNRSNLHANLSQKFLALVREYQTLQTDYKEKYRERVQRQAGIVKPGVTNEEVDQMIETGTSSFVDQILAETKHTEAKNALLEMQEQQRDLKHLERSIQELNQLFIDMSTIVEAASERVDSIEEHVSESMGHASSAVVDLTRANESRMTKRRRVATTIGVVVTGLVIVAVVVGALFAAKVFA